MNAVKRLLRWFGKGIAEHAREAAIVGVLSAGALAAVVRHWLAEQAECIAHASCAIAGLRLNALVLGVSLLLIAVILLAVLLWRSRARVKQLQSQLQPPPFEPVRVEDERCHLYWVLRVPPNQWRDWAAPYQVSPELVAAVIGGPFHAQGCNGRLAEDWSLQPAKGPTVPPECPVCGVELWTPRRENMEPVRIRLFEMRWQVLQELQRLDRNRPLTDPVVLKRLEYWKAMTPTAGIQFEQHDH